MLLVSAMTVGALHLDGRITSGAGSTDLCASLPSARASAKICIVRGPLLRVGRWILEPVLRVLLLGILALIWIVAYLSARYKVHRRGGAWHAIDNADIAGTPLPPLRTSSGESLASVTLQASADWSDTDRVFGYSAYGHTAYDADARDDIGRAHELASSAMVRPDELDTDAGSFLPDDDTIWDHFELDNPAVRNRFQSRVPLGRLLLNLRLCMYCESPLSLGCTDRLPRPGAFSCSWQYYTGRCGQCGWWYVTHLEHDGGSIIADLYAYNHAHAVMRRFDALALDTPLELAREFLARNPHKMARFDPFRFEDLLADCLRDVFSDANVIKVGGRKDGGIDIKAVTMGGETTLIQIKRHADFSKSEGVRAIRELQGVMLQRGIPRGMVITTAHGFSPQAQREAARPSRFWECYSMDLLTLADVKDLLGPPGVIAASPWEAHGIRLDVVDPAWSGSNEWIDWAVLPPRVRDHGWGSPWRW